MFIRSNFGLELRIANHPGADADIEVTYARNGTLRHPSENLEEARQVRELGEVEYNRRARTDCTEYSVLGPRVIRACFPATSEIWRLLRYPRAARTMRRVLN